MDAALSPSRIARQGLGLAPARGGAAAETSTCMACTREIRAGEPAIPWAPSKSTFTDWHHLGAPTRRVCADCALFLENKLLMRAQKCVISTTGAWSLARDAHRTWLLTDPPEPPFVVLVSDAMKQHLVWRAAPTLDRDLIAVQLGRSALRIDRPLLLEAVTWCAEVAALARDAGLKVTPNHPYLRLDRDLAETDHACLRPDIGALAARHAGVAERLERLAQLGPGEYWGLAVLAKARPAEPVCEPL